MKTIIKSIPRIPAFISLFAISIAFFILGIILSETRPIWFAPPSHASTPITYWFIAQLWIPVWFLAVWKMPSQRLFFTLLSMALLLPCSVAANLVLAPQNNTDIYYFRKKDYGYLRIGGTIEQHCLKEESFFICELGLSEDDQRIYTVYHFKLVDGLPIMLLTKTERRDDCHYPGYIACYPEEVP